MKPIFTDCGCEFEYGAWLVAECEHGRTFTHKTWRKLGAGRKDRTPYGHLPMWFNTIF